MQNSALIVAAIAIERDVIAIPEHDRVIGIQRDQLVLEVVILDVPDRLLLLARINPDSHTVVLAIISIAILLNF